eukprot:GGOE01041553.1.p1 GENE.GGOE01041553.1~~GGOE01041553.1.p1  ORF type:complete len:126 (-),score=33.24 GGOE01041553.1:217-561(-)
MSATPGPPPEMSPDALNARLADYFILDVRTAAEDFLMGHIPGATRLSKSDVLSRVPKEKPVVVACLTGHRSIPMAAWLLEQGYQEVNNLTGGFLAWKGAGLRIERGSSTQAKLP